MAAIRGCNTKPEMVLRQGLHARGFRYRLHSRKLAGTPDIVLPKYRALIFVNGCFWHGHDCPLFRWPATRPEFWHSKITANMARDRRNIRALEEDSWRVATVWECSLKGKRKLPSSEVLDCLSDWIEGHDRCLVVEGQEGDRS
ncbi:very short patch repair endonuclease [Rhodovulum sulfidophilum]|uniref:very short patch repair endonuclease n=1 Tax=Rhodovulum sulfidophilum TaxID=35806 RepID=UPI002DD41EE9|nr:very short patch repair endonuclease [Rhodovulum sulfidophilum]